MAGSKVSTSEDDVESRAETVDSPLLDSATATVKKMIAQGKERGYVTYNELNGALLPGQVSSEQIEDTMAMLSEMGINVIDGEEGEEPQPADDRGAKGSASTAAASYDETGSTDDPVRLYLREMGSVELGQIDMAVELAPDNVEANYELAKTYEVMGKRDKAVASWKKVTSLSPTGRSIPQSPPRPRKLWPVCHAEACGRPVRGGRLSRSGGHCRPITARSML